MFRTTLGPVDPIGDIVGLVRGAIAEGADDKQLRARVEAAIASSSVYLRPETAQAMFVQFMNVQQSTGIKVPFGIAQMGKSFRNEVTAEHFIFRSCEFEQMECEYFVPPGEGPKYLEYWKEPALKWWQAIGLKPENLRFRAHDADELAHYSDGCFDVEYKFPWGWDELEGIASRTDYDLKAHAGLGQEADLLRPGGDRPGDRQAGLALRAARRRAGRRGDARRARGAVRRLRGGAGDAEGKGARTVLRLHPRLAPIKAAILPLVKKDGMPEIARRIADQFFAAGDQREVRRAARDRQALRASRRDRHAILPDGRHPDPHRRHRHDPPPRRSPPGAHQGPGGRRRGPARPSA
jgi:glycyl-tRNA synthetase